MTLKPLDLYLATAHSAGCPSDQLRNFRRGNYVPQPKQLAFSAAARECDEPGGPTQVGFGGSRGPGKSTAVFAQAALDDCQRVPGLKFLYLRKVGKQAREQFEDLRKVLLRSIPHNYNRSEGVIHFRNESRILIGHFHNEADVDNYLGIQYDGIIIEEATSLSLTKRQAVRDSNRSSIPGWRPRIYETTNPGGVGHCVPYGEVLTPNGWVDIRTMQTGDPVYTVNPDGEMVESQVEQVHKSDYSGDLIRVDARGLRMVCTSNHSVAKVGGVRAGLNTRTGRADRFSLVPFSDLPGQATILRSVSWVGNTLPPFSPPVFPMKRQVKSDQPKTITGRQFAALLGWFLSEGFTVDRDRAFGIAQSKEEGRDKIRALLDECGFKSAWDKSSAMVYAPDWWSYFAQFGKCREKFIPDWVKQGDPHDLTALFDSLVDGDGHRAGDDSGQYYTISKSLADDVSEVAIKLGYIVSVYQRQRLDRDGLTYCVNFKKTKSGGTELLTGYHVYDVDTTTRRISDIETEHYTGPVYCIGVPDTHTFIIRQDGAVWVSGNSWFKSLYIDPARSGHLGDTRFIFATVEDNRFIDQDYQRKLEQNTGWRLRAYRYGDWDIVAGQFFTNFRHDVHVLPPAKYPFQTIPANWPVWGSLDYGHAHPTSAHLHTTGDGIIYTVGEHWAQRTPIKRHAEALQALCERWGRVPRFWYAGHDCFAKRESEEDSPTIAQKYKAEGIILKPANVNRISGASELSDRLGEVDQGIEPRWFIFDTCPKLIECLPTLEHDPNRPEDVLKVDIDENGQGGDDSFDSARYGLISVKQKREVQIL